MKRFLTTLFALSILTTPALSWPVKAMNDTISSVNFIVNRGCAGTLISKEHRLILTNHHCLSGGVMQKSKKVVDGDGKITTIQVEVLRDLDVKQIAYDGHQIVGESSYKAQIVARWKESDLALLQIRANIPNGIEAKIFAGDKVLRGEPVYAVGNPLGLDATVTKGVISSTTRMFRAPWADNTEVSFIQIDAGIAPGNSGGSLFNDTGELIGVPAAVFTGNGHLGLVIPFFRIQEFLTDNCWGEVWDDMAASRDVCLQDIEDDKDSDDK